MPPSFALGKSRKLLHPWEFRKFFGRNEIFRLTACVVYRIPNELGHFRLGITLKARGTSIERNQVKRAIREAIRVQAETLGSFDYNVVIPGTRKMSHPYARKLRRCLLEELPRSLGVGGRR